MRTSISLKKVAIPPLGCHLIVTVSVNSIKVCLVLDTGASRSVIDQDYLNEIIENIQFKEESYASAGVGASELKSLITTIDEFKIGRLIIKDFQIAAMDLSHVRSSYLTIGEGPIFGVLGGDILEKYAAKIDYSKMKLQLTELTE